MQNKMLSTSEYLKGIREGDKMLLGKAITLIESTHPNHREQATELLAASQPFTGNAIRIGITGVPGVGKSTFIEAFGSYLIQHHGKKVGVLAIDPSSSKSRGSILGDKTRMSGLSTNENAYVRPSPSGGDLGGVRQTTTDTIVLLEAAGYDVILIETVGVGQSETLVHNMVDFFLLLMLAGAGDSLQGIKRGIMEMADAIVINKADGDNLNAAKQAAKEYQMALSLLANSREGWKTRTHYCSAIENTRLDTIWNTISDFIEEAKESGTYYSNRENQKAAQFADDWFSALRNEYEDNQEFKELYIKYEKMVQAGTLSSRDAAQKLIEGLRG
jgi:LAO/AO transport system kinase